MRDSLARLSVVGNLGQTVEGPYKEGRGDSVSKVIVGRVEGLGFRVGEAQ